MANFFGGQFFAGGFFGASDTATGSGGGGRYFGYYPERELEIKREIKSLVRQKKKIERKFKAAPLNTDFAKLAAMLTELQARLTVLVTEYEMIRDLEEPEESLMNIFSSSFYD